MKTAGVIFDFYDDPKGEVLKRAFPTADDLPESIKVAHILSPEEREVLRDDAFAMVAVNDGKLLRKFACVDKGNTILSALYFDKVAHLLPEDLREQVDEKIKGAIFEFNLAEKAASAADFVVKHQRKIGLGLGTAAAAGLAIPSIVKDTKKAVAKRGAEKTAAATPGRKRDPMQQPLVSDDADWAQRTNLVSVRGGVDSSRVTQAASVMKTASAYDLSNHNPVELEERTVTKTAMASGRYPLDSYSDVKQAIAYFDENWKEMDPADRREYCVKTASRANELGIKLAGSMLRYASTTYADDVDAHIANRRAHTEPEYHEMYNALQEKRAEIEPEKYAELLGEIDKLAGADWLYGGEVCDPFLSTFGGLGEPHPEVVYKTASAQVTDEQLHELASRDGLKGVFDFSDDFNKDPVSIFASLPDDAKAVIAGLV